MAYLFSMSLECGPNERDAQDVAAHFGDRSFILATGKASRLVATTQRDEEGNWCAVIRPDNVSTSGAATLEDAIELSELGFRLYALLLNAPAYRFALAGVEVEELLTRAGLRDHVANDASGAKIVSNLEGLVLSREIWAEVGRPLAFFPFGESHRWKPYHGEYYSPTGAATAYGKHLQALRAALPSWRDSSRSSSASMYRERDGRR